jgi:hypothetical protein
MTDGPKYQAFHALARWSAGLLQGFPPYEDIDRPEVMREAIRQVAVINLKKTTGDAASDHAVIHAYAAADAELLREQIRRIAPNVVVACGTLSQLIWLLDLPVDPDQPGREIIQARTGAIVIPMRHPSMSENRETYSDLRDITGRSQFRALFLS